MCPSITLKIFCYSDIKYLFNQSQISCYKLYHPQISIQPQYYNHNILKRYLPRNIFPVIPISDILFQYHPQIYQYHSDNILLQYHSQVSVLQYYHLKYPGTVPCFNTCSAPCSTIFKNQHLCCPIQTQFPKIFFFCEHQSKTFCKHNK